MFVPRSLLLLHIALAAASPLATRQDSSNSSFEMYAYGEGIGGMSVFASGVGGVYVGDFQSHSDNQSAPILFAFNQAGGLGSNPNNSAVSTDPTWSDLMFSIPKVSSADNQVGLLASSNASSNMATTGFVLYGHYVLVEGDNDSLESLWYALPSGEDNIWTLNWNGTEDTSTGKVPLNLRTIKPSNES